MLIGGVRTSIQPVRGVQRCEGEAVTFRPLATQTGPSDTTSHCAVSESLVVPLEPTALTSRARSTSFGPSFERERAPSASLMIASVHANLLFISTILSQLFWKSLSRYTRSERVPLEVSARSSAACCAEEGRARVSWAVAVVLEGREREAGVGEG